MTTPDLKAIEERLSTCGFLPQTDADILALLGMVREAQEYAKSLQPGYWHQKAVEELSAARATIEANTETFRSIIASASGRLVWAVDGRGSPEQAVRAVEALGEAYGALQREYVANVERLTLKPETVQSLRMKVAGGLPGSSHAEDFAELDRYAAAIGGE
jgi:hypothetical protein